MLKGYPAKIIPYSGRHFGGFVVQSLSLRRPHLRLASVSELPPVFPRNQERRRR